MNDQTVVPHHKLGKSQVGIKSIRENKHNRKETHEFLSVNSN